MEVSISVEQFLAGDSIILQKYLDYIIKVKKDIPNLSIHFDYFIENIKAYKIINSYADKIAIDMHLMGISADISNFRSLCIDVRDTKVLKFENQGIVFDLGVGVKGYEDLIKKSNFAIVMTVKCGKSGQAFNESALCLVQQIKDINPKIKVIVDGGINETNINFVKNAGVDIAVVGNYAKKHYESGTLVEAVNRLLRT